MNNKDDNNIMALFYALIKKDMEQFKMPEEMSHKLWHKILATLIDLKIAKKQ